MPSTAVKTQLGPSDQSVETIETLRVGVPGSNDNTAQSTELDKPDPGVPEHPRNVSGVQRVEDPTPGSYVERVCDAIRVALEEGSPTQTHVARSLCVGERTLRRRLQREDTHFRSLLDTARRQLACEKLASTSMSLTQLAMMLGFSHQSAFTRAFRRWYGVTPSAWRASARTYASAYRQGSGQGMAPVEDALRLRSIG